MKPHIYEPFLDSHRVLPKLRDAMGEPGCLVWLPHVDLSMPIFQCPYPLLIVLALLEHKRTFRILDPQDRLGGRVANLQHYVASSSGARPASADKADVVLLYGLNEPDGGHRSIEIDTVLKRKTGILVCHLEKIAHAAFGPGCLNLEVVSKDMSRKMRIGLCGLDDEEILAAVHRARPSVMAFPRTDIIISDCAGRVIYLPHSVYLSLRDGRCEAAGSASFRLRAAVGE